MKVQLCECHPRKEFFGFRLMTNYPFENIVNLPLAGRVCFQLARPLKGYHDHGWYLTLGGWILSWTPMRVQE